MPGMPVFQDSPSQLKGQIYVLKGANVAPLEVDTSGNLTVAGNVGLTTGTEVGLASGTTVGLASGTTVELAAGTAAIGTVGLASGTTVELAAGTAAIGTVGLASGTTVELAAGTAAIGTVGLASGTTVELAAGTAAIGTVGLASGTKVQNDLVFTNLDSFGADTALTSKDVEINAIVEADSQDISVETSYNWFVKNTGSTSSAQDITLMVELSPDGIIWIEDTGVAVTIPFNTSKMITVNNFLKNARFVITGGTAATTVISCFQAQH